MAVVLAVERASYRLWFSATLGEFL